MKKILRVALLLLLCAVYFLTSPGTVSAALGDEQQQVFSSGIKYFNVDDGTTCAILTSVSPASAGSIALTGNDNAQKAWNYFSAPDKGLSPVQVAGILGNLQRESGINPMNVQGNKTPDTPDPSNIKVGWGLMQWTPGSKILNIAKQAKISTPIHELGTQLEIVWWHLNVTSPTGEKNVISRLKTKTTIDQAVVLFEEEMEGAGVKAIPERIKFATQFYNKFSGSTAPVATTTGAPTGCGAPVGSGNAATLDGFTVYSQYDPAWKDKPYSISTVGKSGCGPSAMAMIITTLTGQQVTPDVTAAFAASKGMYYINPQTGKGEGSSWNIAPVLAPNWGLKAEKISKNITEISTALQAGKFVILSGSGQLPFSTGGHYIVIRGIDPSGKLLIGDSGHENTSTQAWDAQALLANANEGSTYAIYK